MIRLSLLMAHIDGDVAGGFLSGLLHPITGLDHVIAMLAVGLWGSQLKQPAIWVLPVTFPAVMAVGGALGVAGVPLPGVEIGVAVSAIVLGLLVTLAARPPLWGAAAVVGAFAIFHGHAHGRELPASAHPLAYCVGFVFATGALHAAGIALGVIGDRPWGARLVRCGGAGIAAAGSFFFWRAVGA